MSGEPARETTAAKPSTAESATAAESSAMEVGQDVGKVHTAHAAHAAEAIFLVFAHVVPLTLLRI